MPDKWEKYVVSTQTPAPADKWAKYAQPSLPAADDLSNVPGALPGMQTPGQAAGIRTPQLHGTSIDYGKVLAAGDVATGAAKGALHTVSSADQYAREHLPAPLTNQWFGLGKPADLQNVQRMATPTNTAQRIGYGGEQAGEFLIPGGAEEAGAAKLATLVPKLGKYAAPTARVATGALSSGLMNKAQGGSLGAGALMGGGGAGIAEGVRAAAPLFAETALGVRAIDRSRGRTPGQAILSETKGVDPGSIAKQAQEKENLYMNQLHTAAGSAPPVDLGPSRLVANDAFVTAGRQNNPDTIRRTGDLVDILRKEHTTSALIPPQVSASRALDLRRGISDLKGSWNPATPNKLADAATGQAYGTLNEGIHAAVPGSQEIDQKVSSLIPVAARAGATDLNAGVLQRILGRFAKPTGALAGGGFGGFAGYKEGGIPGAVAGAGIGLVAPELLSSPKTLMGVARASNSAAVRPVVRALTGAGLQATRKSLYDKP